MKSILFICVILFSLAESKSYDSCYKLIWDKDKQSKNNEEKAYQCRDKTISFVQPNWTSYNGLCGATAAANAYAMLCGEYTSPIDLYKEYFHEYFDVPGITTKTLKDGLNSLFSERECKKKFKWVRVKSNSISKFLTDVDEKTNRFHFRSKKPMIILKRSGRSSLHYVTLVKSLGIQDLKKQFSKLKITNENLSKFARFLKNEKKCAVFYNEYGSQKKSNCGDFMKTVTGVDEVLGVRLFFKDFNYLYPKVIKK